MKFRNRKLYKKAHFYTILYDLTRLFPLLVVPVLQNLLYKPTTTAAFITNFSISALCVVFLFAYIILEYRSTMYLEKEKSVYTKKGFFLKKELIFPTTVFSLFMLKGHLCTEFSEQGRLL